jgi:hypothetical protein
MQQELERMHSLREICSIFNISRNLAVALFRDRPGVLNLAANGKRRPAYRIPTTTLLSVLTERGYTRDEALTLLRRLPLEDRYV